MSKSEIKSLPRMIAGKCSAMGSSPLPVDLEHIVSISRMMEIFALWDTPVSFALGPAKDSGCLMLLGAPK